MILFDVGDAGRDEKTMSLTKQDLLRTLPAVESLLRDPRVTSLVEAFSRTLVTDAVRDVLNRVRRTVLAGTNEFERMDGNGLREEILRAIVEEVRSMMTPHYRKAVNATGIILHTGLGRAVLPRAAIERIAGDLSGYSLLQLDVVTGRRGSRDKRIEWLLKRITGAEAATVVNNNAAATSIVLNTVAQGKEVIVSRGQLVEIGGSFRLPEVMAFSGATLVEVGTTNKTHPRDYERAITENTAAILRVHPSNYRIMGFTSEVPLKTLVEIARANRLVMIDDVGAGALIDTTRFGFEPENTLQDSVRFGADIITCSGDKLIGGSQAGLILGRAEFVRAVRKNQFARIVRPGKLTLAALEATLSLFLDEATAVREVPTLRMLTRSVEEITEQAERIVHALRARTDAAEAFTVEGFSQMGSGSLPTQNLPTRLIGVIPKKDSAESFARKLRAGEPPVFARVKENRVLFDPRTILEGEEAILVDAIVDLLRYE